MIGFARFTAIIFILIGLILLVGGIGMAVTGVLAPATAARSAPSIMPGLSVLSVFAGALVGGIVAFQGLVLAAVGQVLWLMAGMTHNMQLSIDYLAELVRRTGNAVQRPG